MGIIEANFPRGGKKPASHASKSISLFSKPDLTSKIRKPNPTKKQRQKLQAEKLVQKEIDNVKPLTSTSAETLSYKNLREGMVVLGCVREVTDMSVSVSLPGRIFGTVLITGISTPYNRILQEVAMMEGNDGKIKKGHKPLSAMFTVGKYVCVKVLEIQDVDSNARVSLSMNPEDIYADWNNSNLKSDLQMVGAVSGVEDHGYVIDLGIPNCRSFLSAKEVRAKEKLGVGELIWCVIKKVESTSAASTVMLTADPKNLNKSISTITSLNNLLPGLTLTVTVDKILSDGLQVKFLNNFIGYINESQLTQPLDSPKKYKVGQELLGRILYIMPTTKFTYISLRGFVDAAPSNKLNIGDIINAHVLGRTSNGIFLKIKNCRGFLSFKRIKKSSNLTNEDEAEKFFAKYSKGTQHSVRILHFDYMDQVFICSNETNIMQTEIFTYSDLTLGQLITGTIKKVLMNGLLISFGRLQGFVPLIHVSDIPIFNLVNNPKYAEGLNVNARVLRVDIAKHNVKLTIKPSLTIDNLHCLTNYEQIKEGEEYFGTVVQVTTKGVLVSFFGDVSGYIPINYLSHEIIKNPEKVFFIGQVIKTTVQDCDKKNNRLTLTLRQKRTESTINVGQYTTGSVINIGSSSLEVSVNQTIATIPAMHLTQHTLLANLLLGTYNEGDVLNDLVCVSTTSEVPILSIREGRCNDNIVIKRKKSKTDAAIKIKKLIDIDQIKVNFILKGSILNISDTGLILQSSIKGFKLHVPANEICDISNDHLNLTKYQPLYAQIIAIDHKEKIVKCSTKLSKVWNFDVKPSTELLSSYLDDVTRIHETWYNSGRPLGAFQMGQIISGTVTRIQKGEKLFPTVVIELPGKVDAVIQPTHSRGGLKIGDVVDCLILWLDFVHNCVEASINEELITAFNESEEDHASFRNGAVVRGQVLLVRPDFSIAVLKAEGSRKLAVLPTRNHINDIIPDLDKYNCKYTYKMTVTKTQNGYTLCVLKNKKLPNDESLSKSNKTKGESEEKQTNSKESKKQKGQLCSDVLEETPVQKQKKVKGNKKNSVQVVEVEQSNIASENTRKKQGKKRKIDTEIEIQQPEKTNTKKQKIEEPEIKAENTKKKKEMKRKIDTEEKNVGHSGMTDTKKQKLQEPESKSERTKKKKENKVDREEKIAGHESGISDTKNQKTEQLEIKSEKVKKKNESNTVNQNSSPKGSKINEQSEIIKTKKQEKEQRKTVPTKIESVAEPEPKSVLGNKSFFDLNVDLLKVKPDDTESSSDEEIVEDQEDKPKKKKRATIRERQQKEREEEERIRNVERALAQADENPQCADHFDRLLLANPDSSMIWINYMAYHLQATEIDKARAVARKALSTISFREEQEKLNVWNALLNLENRFGTNESFSQVLEEASRLNDSLTIYIKAMDILAESSKPIELTNMVDLVIRRFKGQTDAWLNAGSACFKAGLVDKARQVMQRALLGLQNKEHVNFIVRFANMENRHGFLERSQALIEQVLTSYPQRIDIWSQYVDTLVKAGEISAARQVLDRAVSQKMPAKKIKVLFKKYIDFETKHGEDKEAANNVRKMALNYVTNASS